MKKVLIIHGHPGKDNLSEKLAYAYKKGAETSGAEIKEIKLSEMDFYYDMPKGYKDVPVFEPCLADAQEKILWADHLVFVYPNWWGLFPAKMKAFIDRVFLPGFAFKYHKDNPLWDKLLTGKSARLIVTMDTPPWYYKLIFRQPGHQAMKRTILGFCGIKPVKIFSVGRVKGASEVQLQKWIKKAELIGRKLN
jgi:putative NADPH-quinone reductase